MPHTGSRLNLKFDVAAVEAWRAANMAPRVPAGPRKHSLHGVTSGPSRRQSDRTARRICEQCQDPAGFTVEEAIMVNSADPLRFCWRVCAADFAAGKTAAQTRKEFAQGLLASGWTRRELRLDGYLDWL